MQTVRALALPPISILEFLHSVSLPSLVFSPCALPHTSPLPYVCAAKWRVGGGRGGLHSPSVQQGNPFLALIRSAKSAAATHTLVGSVHIQFGKEVD